jgi:hypothetical protein
MDVVDQLKARLGRITIHRGYRAQPLEIQTSLEVETGFDQLIGSYLDGQLPQSVFA